MNKRLYSLSKLFDETVCYDIGSDHGYLIDYLFSQHKIDKAYVIEINQEPLNAAKKNLAKYDKITYYLSDGLSRVSEIESESGIVIAGMGGKLISSILNNAKDKLNNNTLYLQANNHEDFLRETINKLNYQIIEEHVVSENNKYYYIIKCQYGKQKLSQIDLICGYNVNVSKEYIDKLKNLKIHYEDVLQELSSNNYENKKIENKYYYICKKLGELNEN